MSGVNFSRLVAFRYLWGKRSEAFITIISVISVIGVAIGVMVLTIVMSVMTGFETALKEKIVGVDSHVVVHASGGQITDWEAVAGTIREIKGVTSISPFTYNQVLVKSDARATGVLLRGVLENTAGSEQLSHYLSAPFSVHDLFAPPEVVVADVEGVESNAQLPGIVIGRQLAQSLQISVGSPVAVLSPQLSPTPFGLVPKFRRFVIAGIYSSGLIEYESGVAYVNLSEAQKFFSMGSAVTGLEVRVADIDSAPQLAREIVSHLGGIGGGYSATDWTVSNQALWDALRLEKRVYFIVLLLIIIMASFSIITTLIMIVLEKRKDIAVLKTMGASTSQVARIFRIQGTLIGGVGTVLGLLLGFTGCFILQTYGFPIDARVFQMSQLPVRMEWQNFLAVGVAAFTICFLATIYPARRASSLEPSDLLRYE